MNHFAVQQNTLQISYTSIKFFLKSSKTYFKAKSTNSFFGKVIQSKVSIFKSKCGLWKSFGNISILNIFTVNCFIMPQDIHFISNSMQ